MTTSGDFELTVEELRAVTAYAIACATPTLSIVTKAMPDDPRPAAALKAAQVCTEGARRTKLQRVASVDAHKAGREAPTKAAGHAATAAGDAAASAFLHPLANPTQLRHILGAAAHAARAAELARGDDPVVAEYMLYGAARRVTPTVREVLERYPRAPAGRTHVALLIRSLDRLIRDPRRSPEPPTTQGPSSMAPGPICGPATSSHPDGERTTGQASNRGISISRPLSTALRSPPRWPWATGRHGSTVSNRLVRSMTTPT